MSASGTRPAGGTGPAGPPAGGTGPSGGFACLHAHTAASDGALAPLDLAELALRQGYKALAVTDHNTTAGYAQLREHRGRYARRGLRIYGGCELTVLDPHTGLHGHLTVLFPDGAAVSRFDAVTRLAAHWTAQTPVSLDQVTGLSDCLYLSGCRGGLPFKAATANRMQSFRDGFGAMLSHYQRRFGDRVYLEVMPDFFGPLYASLRNALRIPLVASIDAHGDERLPLLDCTDVLGLFPSSDVWRNACHETLRVAGRLKAIERGEPAPAAPVAVARYAQVW